MILNHVLQVLRDPGFNFSEDMGHSIIGREYLDICCGQKHLGGPTTGPQILQNHDGSTARKISCKIWLVASEVNHPSLVFSTKMVRVRFHRFSSHVGHKSLRALPVFPTSCLNSSPSSNGFFGHRSRFLDQACLFAN